MTREEVLSLGRRLSEEHRLTMHAWAAIVYEGRLHLGIYLYKGEATVWLQLVHRYDAGTDADEVKMLVDYLNTERGMAGGTVKLFVRLYDQASHARASLGNLLHLHP